MIVICRKNKLRIPAIILYASVNCMDDLIYRQSAEWGSLLLDGIGDAIVCKYVTDAHDLVVACNLDLLQATRMRLSKADFISCPSCGRTLFDLQTTTDLIQKQTGHLKGVKIAVMGCIVNGPGEMADADFGYVGAGPGKIHLYREKEIVKNNIPASEAVAELIVLIKEHGMWQEP